jgi:aminoglycoside N3'-acetyltransferase
MIRRSSGADLQYIQRITHLPETAWCSAKHYVLKQIQTPVGSVAEPILDTVLEQYRKEDVVFVHIGLSDIKTALQRNPYDAIIQKLDENFESVLAPGFTRSFRETGVFDIDEMPPELGAFSSLFFEEATYRTPDPLHSILVDGAYRFDGCTFRDTFGPDGCYGQLSADNVLCLNIGTPWLVSTQLHYIERVCDVPYAKTVKINGEFRTNGTTEQITQKNYQKNKYLYFWNRRGIRDDMISADVMDHYSLNGLNIMGFRAGDMRAFLEDKIDQDPYYLVR